MDEFGVYDDDIAFNDLPDDLLLAALSTVEGRSCPTSNNCLQQLNSPTMAYSLQSSANQTKGAITENKSEMTTGVKRNPKQMSITEVFKPLSATSSQSPKMELANILDDPAPIRTSPSKWRPSCPHRYDSQAICTWIYPTNYPVRLYQFNIVKKSLFRNTLVCLPTGLGKTFIAAVVMYNYWRWFPHSKLVFMAPTKPLVAQQIEACYRITGIPREETAEMTGAQSPDDRALTWAKKRVFFLTPQVMQSDLQRGTCSASEIVCIVVDEAHRATGNYAYCDVVRTLSDENPYFRILALSATPGSDVKTVQAVVQNLKISCIEIRSEESMDIQPYSHQRTKEVVVVQLSPKVKEFQSRYAQDILSQIVARLNQARAYYEKDPLRISKFALLSSRKTWRERSAGSLGKKESGAVERDFALLISLVHALELLVRHGISSFHKYLSDLLSGSEKQNSSMQTILRGLASLDKLLCDVAEYLSLPLSLSHPKLERLESIVLTHFLNHNDSMVNVAEPEKRETRVMIFSEFRASVEEIVTVLNRHQPLLRVMQFVGQASKNGRGFSQKEQLAVIEKFHKGDYNILVSTSIGEEGLDIGDIDLIVCYDSQSSPVRMLQRMGRTGRKRDGKIVLLVTEGKEHQQYQKTQTSYKSIQSAIVNQGTSRSSLQLYEYSPRLFPEGMNTPACVQKKMDISEKSIVDKLPRSKKPRSAVLNQTDDLDMDAYEDLFNCKYDERSDPRARSHFHWQSSLQSTHLCGHSSVSRNYVLMMQKISLLEGGDNISNEDWIKQLELAAGKVIAEIQSDRDNDDSGEDSKVLPPPSRPKQRDKGVSRKLRIDDELKLSPSCKQEEMLNSLLDSEEPLMALFDDIASEQDFHPASHPRTVCNNDDEDDILEDAYSHVKQLGSFTYQELAKPDERNSYHANDCADAIVSLLGIFGSDLPLPVKPWEINMKKSTKPGGKSQSLVHENIDSSTPQPSQVPTIRRNSPNTNIKTVHDLSLILDDDSLFADINLDEICKSSKLKTDSTFTPSVTPGRPQVDAQDFTKRVSLKLRKTPAAGGIKPETTTMTPLKLSSTTNLKITNTPNFDHVTAETKTSRKCQPKNTTGISIIQHDSANRTPNLKSNISFIHSQKASSMKSGRKRHSKDVIASVISPNGSSPIREVSVKQLRRLRRHDSSFQNQADEKVPQYTRRLRKSTNVVRRGSERLAKEETIKGVLPKQTKPKPKFKLKHFCDLEADVSEGSCSDSDGGRRRWRHSQDSGDEDLNYSDDSELRDFVVDGSQDEDVQSSMPYVHLSPTQNPAFGYNGRYKMKFAGGITLSQKYANIATENDEVISIFTESSENEASFRTSDCPDTSDSQVIATKGVVQAKNSIMSLSPSQDCTPVVRSKLKRRNVLEDDDDITESVKKAKRNTDMPPPTKPILPTASKKPSFPSASPHIEMSLDMPSFSLKCPIDHLLQGIDFDDLEELVDDDMVAANVMDMENEKPSEMVNRDQSASKKSESCEGLKPAHLTLPEKPSAAPESKLMVLVDNRELRTPVCGLLRTKYKLDTNVVQLSIGDYIVSNRVGIERKSRSDLLQSVFSNRLSEQLRNLKATYEIPVMIIEDEPPTDPSKFGGRSEGLNPAHENQVEGIVASLLRQPPLRILFSKDKAETAQLIHELALSEAKRDASIIIPKVIPEKKNHVFQFLLHIKTVGYVTAWNIVERGRFISMQDLVQTDVETLVKRVPNLARSKALMIVQHFQRHYDEALNV